MSDGSRLRQSWQTALNDAEAQFRQLYASLMSQEWKRAPNPVDSISGNKKGKARLSTGQDITDVLVHRKSVESGEDVYRLVLDVPAGEEAFSLEAWKAVLATPELRQEWDPAVEEAHLVEMFDQTTRISKTNFTLGWPANPRDAVTISRSIQDSLTLIDVTTSLPRSADEPAYLRPSPPYVRSHVTLFAWCIQYILPQAHATSTGESSRRRNNTVARIRITCFWQHDLKMMWNFGSSTSLAQQLSTMTLGLLKTVSKRGSRVPRLIGYGNGISVDRVRFQADREALTIEYAVVPDDDEQQPHGELHGMDDVRALREQRRLTRSVECLLPCSEGWDVQVTTRGSSEAVEKLPWSAQAIKRNSSASVSLQPSPQSDQLILHFSHSALSDDHSVLKVRVKIELSSPSGGLRLNGIPQSIEEVEERDPSSYHTAEQILQDVSSTMDLSFQTSTSVGTMNSVPSTSSSTATLVRRNAERTAAVEKSILSRVRRNYIYFSSLLQEPEAKWRQVTDARGVSITQLDSIDPTLVVYRAEATFVGVSLWDLYGIILSPGARGYWDKQHEDAVLLEDVNELTGLWHYKTKPAWPINGRDSVVLKTVYKSSMTIHVFSFSADDPHIFPNIPPAESNVIRTQVDLQGWAIEALSPTTTLLTLLEQSDPKGWANKASIPQQMINTLAGIGEFAIKCGGPPIVTRLSGGKANDVRYDLERGSFRVEYEAAPDRRASVDSSTTAISDQPTIECELRCDIDVWGPSLDIIVDPPPQAITCLRRHRLSPEGGGLWLTHSHDALFVNDERLLIIVRRAPGKEKGLVMVNGAKIPVDVEELQKHEIETLMKQKRVKPPRIPLDQPPVITAVRRRKVEWAQMESQIGVDGTRNVGALNAGWASAPKINPLAKFISYAVESASATVQQAVSVVTPTSSNQGNAPSPNKLPIQYALEALAWTQETHKNISSEGWILAADKGFPVHRRIFPEISPVFPVYKGSKVVEGISGEELASVITNPNCRKFWDDRFSSHTVLESYGGEIKSSFLVTKTNFSFRDRAFFVASIMSRTHTTPPPPSRRGTGAAEVVEHSINPRGAIFCVSASFSPDSLTPPFSASKMNPYSLPVGRVHVDAWVLETLDPYTKENYAIPSAMCTRLVVVDYSGAIPAAMNSMINTALPRAVLAVEAYVKSLSPSPITRLPTPGIIIAEKKVQEGFLPTAWKLRQRDEQRTLVDSVFDPDDRVYKTTILVKNPFPISPSRFGARNRGPTTQRPSKLPMDANVRSAVIDVLPETSPSHHSPAPSPSPPGREILNPGNTHKDRAASASSVSSIRHSRERTISTLTVRGRSPSAAFTVKGEVRQSIDFLVGEVVIDSKLYPEGYSVILRSWLRAQLEIKGRTGKIPLRALNMKDTNKRPETHQSKGGEQQQTQGQGHEQGTGRHQQSILPLSYSIHTMPSSPLHSSGLNAESPSRHLLRLTLPTAQYEVSTLEDPLTGEVQTAPPMPEWLIGLLEERRDDDGTLNSLGAIVQVEVRPGNGTNSASSKGSSQRGMGMITMVDGKEVVVSNDKESLTTLGREELLDDRINNMAILSRMPNEAEPLPDPFKIPLALADDLLDPVSLEGDPLLSTDERAIEGGRGTGRGFESRDTAEANRGTPGGKEEHVADEKRRMQQSMDLTPGPHAGHAASTSLLRFLNGYSNALTRFKPSGANIRPLGANGTLGGVPSSGLKAIPGAELKEMGESCIPGTLGGFESSATSPGISGGSQRQTLYPVSTVIVVALIAFLIGSLLRSLLSPADFIYFARGAEETATMESGWRELRRLFELRYLGFGWDLQIAVVRRD